MSGQSGTVSRRVDHDSEPLVITNLIGANVPSPVMNELLDEGIVGQLDWGLGASANKDEFDDSNKSGKGSVGRYAEFSRVGGYVVAHEKGGDRLVVGRADPSSIRFEEIEGGERDGVVLKCVDLDEWAEVETDEFDNVHDVVEKRPRNVFNKIQNKEHAERIVTAVAELERKGRINR